MIEVRIPKDIREFKPKFAFGLTLRQFVYVAIAVIICVSLYLFGNKYIPKNVLEWIIFLIATPLILLGFFRYNKMNFEQFVVVWFRSNFVNQRRPYQVQSVFSELRLHYISEMIKDKEADKDKLS